MHDKSYVFAQLASFLNRSKFNRIVAKYHDDSYIKYFTCWNQPKVLMFGQLSRCNSLRDLIVAVEAHRGKVKFSGFGDSVTRSNLAKANQNRDYHIFEEFAYYIVEQTRNMIVTKTFDLSGNIYVFDSTTIELCPHTSTIAENVTDYGLILQFRMSELKTGPKPIEEKRQMAEDGFVDKWYVLVCNSIFCI